MKITIVHDVKSGQTVLGMDGICPVSMVVMGLARTQASIERTAIAVIAKESNDPVKSLERYRQAVSDDLAGGAMEGVIESREVNAG